MAELLYNEETYKIIGICMEVHNQSGKGFNKLVYSDALEIEFIDNNIKYSKEQKINIREKL
jgi:GxxExxY protein